MNSKIGILRPHADSLTFSTSICQWIDNLRHYGAVEAGLKHCCVIDSLSTGQMIVPSMPVYNPPPSNASDDQIRMMRFILEAEINAYVEKQEESISTSLCI